MKHKSRFVVSMARRLSSLFGSDNNNISGAAGGKLLSADANINAQSSYQAGVLKIGTDIHAGASVAQGELKGGVQLEVLGELSK